MSDVVLVQMPYASLPNPSIALGLLKSYLDEAEISTNVVYGNLAWAEEIGLDIYRLADGTLTPHLVGEWTFSGAAFPGVDLDKEGFFELIEESASLPYFRTIRTLHPGASMVSVIKEVRRRAGGFVDKLARNILAKRPRIVGCTSMFQQHCASLALLRRIRQLDPGVVTMMGGANCEGPMGEVTHQAFDWVDFVVSGEADGFIADLCHRVLAGGSGVPAIELPEGVLGPAHRRDAEAPPPESASGSMVVLGSPPQLARAMVHDLDETAMPNYDDYFQSLEESPLRKYVRPALLVETSRGCWWGAKHHCTFCGLNGSGMVYRSKSPERAVAEIDYLIERYGVRRIEAVDNIIDMGHIDSFLGELAKRDEPPVMFYEVKANLKREHVERFAKAGIRAIQPGIESLHAEVLKLIDKGNSATINVQLMKWALELGISVHWSFIVLIPGESDAWYEEIVEWLPLIEHLTPPMGVIRLRFDRFSPYHKSPEKYGLELTPFRTYSHVYPLPNEMLSNLAYFFESKEDLAREGTSPEIVAQKRPGLELLKQRVDEWQRRSQGAGAAAGQPVLSMTDDGETISIRDTRSVATRTEHALRGAARLIYLTCDHAIKSDRLVGAVNHRFDQELTWSEIEPALEELLSDKLILPVESRYLSLAVWEGRSVATEGSSPFGKVDFEQAIEDIASYSLAAAVGSSPGSVAIRDLFGA